MIKEAILWEPLEDKKVRCFSCSFKCIIPEGKIGHCRTRKNFDGKLKSLIYGTVTSVASDPIEKKPLYHFYPGSYSYSMGTVGCNFRCEHCQNWTISQADIESVYTEDIMPAMAVKNAIDTGCKSLSFTYNEPTIWVEFTHDTSMLGHEKGLKSIYVTNGYATAEHLEAMKGLLDAYRVDIKAFKDAFYKKVCSARLEPVLTSTKIAKDMGMHIEVINLVIPGLNDSAEEIGELSKWVYENLGPETPTHFTRFQPMYHMTDLAATSLETLERAYNVAKETGLKYVYLGNVPGHKYESTWCPSCNELLIERLGFRIMNLNLTKDKKCPKCGEKIPIIGNIGP
ncbi:AmmeMemoRadiSam system radical SAM enzyme [Methanocella sp. CWC-04]|uniref:AmmeMemoRadiSam system radical SAM enzyme n=1 Tax=Methanooceanicella nereidis TaxID=2052831 RepID=A0AAP2RB70_9EURY|nr:AmmeMemoRadiSam system radical SAM enzyme [Methanocella sp. CWC-04]MCD1293691.1 AmmeMemoRadiSam system radical SAM enzyme [Methanocella sp. CWC-04]